MKFPNKNAIAQAAMAAAFAAWFNSDWLKAQLVELKRDLDFGGMRPYVPWALAAGAFLLLKKGR